VPFEKVSCSHVLPSIDSFLSALQQQLGDAAVQTGAAVEARFHTDWSGQPPVAPLALVRPRSSEEVAAVLRLCMPTASPWCRRAV
jgi:FAD/FMN-containing dehydrogenase